MPDARKPPGLPSWRLRWHRLEVGSGHHLRFSGLTVGSTSLRDTTRMPHGDPSAHSPSPALHTPGRQSEATRGSHPAPLSLSTLPRQAADLILLGDLTGRYASGSYTRLAADGRGLALRQDRQGASDHGHRITAAIACYVARATGSVDDLLPLLMRPDHEGGRHVQTIAARSGHARARDYVHRVWETACKLVADTADVESRHQVREGLATLRARIETAPWPGERGRTALRVLLAHLGFAEIAGGRRHAASERQTAEAAGISRQTLRAAYSGVLKPAGWLRRLKVGRGTEGSTWYIADGPHRPLPASVSQLQTTQRPPGEELEEWSPPETPTADIDSTVFSHLMDHDAFAQHGLGSSALIILAALHANPRQSPSDLVATSAVSRATAYRTLQRLAGLGLVHQTGTLWALAPGALQGMGNSPAKTVTRPVTAPALGWDSVAARCGTTGISEERRRLHAAERAAYRAALEQLASHRSKALVVVRDGRTVVVPSVRPDEIPAAWHAPGCAIADPSTGLIVPGWRVATDGRLIHVGPDDERSYDELTAAYQQALLAWESAA